jgi:uncharacterized protein involved in exopolysaccharide biosynthesis
VTSHRRIRTTTDLTLILWQRRVSIVLAAVVAGLVAAGVSLLLPRAYEAQVEIMIAQSRLSAALSGSSMGTFFNPRLFNTFESIIDRNEALTAAIQAHPKLQEEGMRADELRRQMRIRLVGNSQIIELAVTLGDRDLAASVANFLADRAVQHTQQELFTDEVTQIRSRLAPELAAAQEHFDSVRARYALALSAGTAVALENSVLNVAETRSEIAIYRGEFATLLEAQRRDAASEQPLRERIRAAQERLTAFRSEHSVDDLERQRSDLQWARTQLVEVIAGAEGDLARLHGELESVRNNTVPGGEAVSAAEAVRLTQRIEGIEATRRGAEPALASLQAQIDAVDQELAHAKPTDERFSNELDVYLEEEKEFFKYSTESLEAFVAAHDQVIAELAAEEAALRELSGRSQAEQLAAEVELEAAQTALMTILQAHEEAALRLEEKHQGLAVVSSAIPPTYPSFPNRKLLTVLAAAFGFLLACIWVVTRENLLAALEEERGAA